jgi:CRP-like cAMP-binding protein
MHFIKGQNVLKSTDTVHSIYFVVEGEINIIMNYNEEEKILETLGRCSNFGAYSVIRKSKFNFIARAVKSVTLQVLNLESINSNS